MVRLASSMACVPWPLLPYCSRFCQRQALGLVVVLPDAMVELAGEAADDGLVAGVGEAEPARGEAAQMLVRADDDDGLAHALGLHRGGDRAGGAAVDEKVGLARRRDRGKAECQRGKEEKREGSNHLGYPLIYSIVLTTSAPATESTFLPIPHPVYLRCWC